MRIVFRPHGRMWSATVHKGDILAGAGRTKEEALGDLFFRHPSLIRLEVVVRPQPGAAAPGMLPLPEEGPHVERR